MKKIWIAVAGLAAVLAVVLVVVMLTSPAERIDSSDVDSLYPYGYEQTAKGLEVHISGGTPKGYRWVAVSESAEIHVTEKKHIGKTAVFLLSADSSCQGTVRFSLRQESDGLAGQCYEITVSVMASARNKLSVLGSSHREISGLAAGTGEGFSYEAADQTDGTVLVRLSAEESMEWTLETKGSSVRVIFDTAEAEATERIVRVEYAKLGQTRIRLCAGETLQAVELYVTTDAENRVSLVSHEIIDYDPAETGILDTYAAEFENVYGFVPLPRECIGVERAVVTWEDSEQAGYLGFVLAGYRWEMYLFADGGSAEPANWCDAPAASVSIDLGDHPALLGTWGAGCSAIWNMDDDTYLLRCEEADSETLRTVAEQVIAVMQHG